MFVPLHSAGLHRSCAEKSVCQMARHPLHVPVAGHDRTDDGGGEDHPDNEDEDLMAELLHFVLT